MKIIHCDLALRNILLTREDEARCWSETYMYAMRCSVCALGGLALS